jgi:restriction system protein
VGLNNLIDNGANEEEIAAFLEERNLPLEEIGRSRLASRIISDPPLIGLLTISNALQWRLQYRRVIETATTQPREGAEAVYVKS